MSGGHTPGPWQVKHGFDGTEIDGPDRISIGVAHEASFDGTTVNLIQKVPCLAEAQANARLIAAAPDLLEACRLVADSSVRNAAYDACVAAIAKATGQ